MLVQIVTENGQKKVIPLTADAGAGLPVGFIAPAYKKGNYSGWLYLDGRDTTGTSEELSTHYPLLYAFLGSNVLPDYREFALVGAEQNTTDVYNASTNPTGTIHDHDVYTEGQAKDDQVQEHYHNIGTNDTTLDYSGTTATTGQNLGGFYIGGTELKTRGESGRKGTVTRGKRKAVYFYIKATSGLSENAQDNVVAQLNEERSYSTSEVNTGKKWIDGKDIYRKVVVFSSVFPLTSSDWTIINNKLSASDLALLQSIKNVISCFINIPVSSTYTIYENLIFAVDGSNIKLQDNKTFTVQANSAMVIEYTKTT